MKKDLISVAKIGKTHGVRGFMKLHLLGDFPEFLEKNKEYFLQMPHSMANKNVENILILEQFNSENSLAKFENYDSPESAKALIGGILCTTKQKCKEANLLKESEFFWFELIGAEVRENGEILGNVFEIERGGAQDFLIIKTAKKLCEQGLSKTFLLPYCERYILKVDSIKSENSTQNSQFAIESKTQNISKNAEISKQNPATKQPQTPQNSLIIHTTFAREILENS